MTTKEKFKAKYTRLKRRISIFYMRTISFNKKEKYIKKPKNLTDSESMVSDIFLTLLHNKDSKLYYDIQTQECYISSGDKTVFVFLEACNVKVINSVFGYDVNIRQDLEGYLLEKFIREMSIRRNTFKKEVLSKINHSLDSTLSKIKDSVALPKK